MITDTPKVSQNTTQRVNSFRTSLRLAQQECRQRGLYFAAKWASSQLNALPKSPGTDSGPEPQNHMSRDEMDVYLLALSYFDCKEFDRVAYILQKGECNHTMSVFLRLYSKFLAGQKRAEEESQDQVEGKVNKESTAILTELAQIDLEKGLDPFLLYLYGLVLQSSQRSNAITALVRSVTLYPWNWSAWVSLAKCLMAENDSIDSTIDTLPKTIMTTFFRSYLASEHNYRPNDLPHLIPDLLQYFPTSDFVLRMQAVGYNNARDFEESEHLFTKLLTEDPFCLDHMDTFSNALFVMEKKAKLSYLAHHASMVDKYRPETCCIIANYHALRGEHDRAITNFRRALRINRNYLPAWTLMGHEFLELKNTHAAIEAYRTATEINPRDFRAWYGLGQAYEVLQMPYYALYYFQRAATLCPYDSRMWRALGQCYETLASNPASASFAGEVVQHIQSQDENGRIMEAIRCYKRALLGEEDVVNTLIKLAQLYLRKGNKESAAWYYEISLGHNDDTNEMETNSLVEACLFLANHYRETDLAKAEKFCREIEDLSPEAKDLIKELRHSREQ